MRKIYQRAMAVALAGTTLLGAGLWHKSHREAPDAKKTVSQNADALPTGVSEATLADIRSSLEKQEYHISYDEQKKKLQSPNRRNNIRAYYEPGKLTVQTRVDTTGEGFKMELVNEGVFADGQLLYTPEAHAKAQHHDNKVLISHDAFTEEFINSEDGVRQNFIIKNAPEGTRQLQVKMTAKGLKVEQSSGNELRFYSEAADGQTRNELVYSDLKCWDANKKPLSARLAYVDNRIQISVDVAGAAYPVTIDPIIANGTPQNSNKVLEINQSYMWLGFSVSSAGDVNGDGYSDVIVGAPQYDKGQNDEGAAFVYMSNASGLTLTAVTLECNQADAKMGYSVASAGDFNGDGFSDVLVGAPYYNGGYSDEGRAFLYFGSAQGISVAATPMPFYSPQANAYFGIAVATAGDIDGDGYSDILISGHQFDYGQAANAGIVLVAYGAATNYKSVQDLSAGQANAMFGYSLAPAGDVDADGYSDIIIGARWYTNGQGQDAEGAAFIYRGGSNGLQGNPTIIEGNQYNAAMGNKVSSAGDVNGDGYSDVLISAYLFDTGIQNQKDHGIVNLYLGSSNGITSQQQPSRTFYGKDNDHMGSSIACAGDVNGDGYSDILLGAEYYDNGQFNEGGVFVYYGSKGNVGVVGDPVATMESNQVDGWFGTAVASAGDVNGDGYSDILVGCYTFDNGQKDEGHVFVYHGGAYGIGTKDAVSVTNSKTGALMGFSVANAGDVNGDGYSDMLVGAHRFDNDQADEGVGVVILGAPNGLGLVLFLECNQPGAMMGFAVAGAGDVDGDGFSDVMAGARLYSNGQALEGAAFIFKGSPAYGVVTANPTVIESNQVDARLGHALSSAGDVNGDGFSDIALGAYQYDKGSSNEGVVMIHYGSANGINTVPSLILEGEQIEAQFGISVACAGDVNADGFADLIVGARYYDKGQANEGAAFIYEGSKNGLNTTPISVLESNQGDAWLGSAVAPAGDVNGDGFSDVLVGSYAFDHGQKDEGSVFVWHGSGSSIKESVVTNLEMNQPLSQFGWSVASAGDVNGDGFDDVIISANDYDNGQPVEGAAFVFHGSTQGLSTIPNVTFEGNQQHAGLGSVSSAGDVNGDGFGDVIVGMPLFDIGTSDEGKVCIFYGSASGLSQINETTILGTQHEGNFGKSVSSTGDLNNDGFSDIVIGEPGYDIYQEYTDEGRAFIYYGSSQGIDSNPVIVNGDLNGFYLGNTVAGGVDVNGDGFNDALIGHQFYSNGQDYEGAVYVLYGSQLKINPANAIVLQSNIEGAEMGGVCSAGDINGDGFGDIAVGAQWLSNGEYDEGAIFIYYGSANGLTNVPTIIESNVASSNFGTVSSAGDVNGDAYSDLVVGAIGYTHGQPNEGAVYLFLGSSNGITPTHNILIEGNQESAFLGNSVAGAGDINGDGFSDIIVSAHQYDNGQTNEGRASIYYGNSTLGTRNNLRLYNTDLATPINHTQFPQTNFGAGLFAKSFTGRNKGKLVWETRPLAQGFSKGSNNRITNSTQSTNSQNAYSNLGTAGFELKNLIDKQGPGTKVRVRVKYDPVLALTGQSYGPWRYLPAYLMGNSTAPVPEEEGNDLSETIQKKPIPIEDRKALELANIYPNPVSNRLNIDFKDKDQIRSLRILTTAGSVAYQSNGFQPFVDVSKLSEGTYFLIITKTDGSHTTRQILIRR